MPRSAIVDLFRLLDGAFEPTVREGVAFVELQVALVREVAIAIFGKDVLLDSTCRDNAGGEFDEVFTSRLQLKALLHHHWEFSRLTNEDAECIKVFLFGSERDRVGVKVEGKPKSFSSSNLRLHLRGVAVSTLHSSDQLFVVRVSESVDIVESTAHPSVSGNPGEQLGAVDSFAFFFAREKHRLSLLITISEAGQS